jgi:hypothetical protein
MTGPEKKRWKTWADGLREEMMTSLTAEVTRSVDEIAAQTATTKAESTLRSERFWRACQTGKRPNDVLATAGFEIDFQQNADRHVLEVTLRLNETWMTILNRVCDRQRA